MASSDHELRIVFDATSDGVLLTAPPRVIDANDTLCSLLGASPAELLSVPDVAELFVAADRGRLQGLLSGKGEREESLRLRPKRGAPVPCRARALRTARGWAIFLRRAQLDEGETDRVPTAAEGDDVRWQGAVDDLPDGVVLIDGEDRVRAYNRALTGMLGLRSGTRLHGRSLIDLLVPESRAAAADELLRARRGSGVRFHSRMRRVGRDETTDVLLSAAPSGVGGGLVVLVADDSAIQTLSERIELTRRMDALATFAGGIAHDFNNLLTGILGNASRVRLSVEPGSEADRAARGVEDSAELAARLTQRLLALVRGQTPDRKLLDLGELVGHTLELIEKILPSSVRLESEVEPELPPVLADESQFQQAILNLCINARDAMKEQGGGRLRIEVRRGTVRKALDDGSIFDEPGVVVQVSDTGPGIPRELRGRIFDPFFTTKVVGRGLGLGLSTVFQLVEAHGGTVVPDDAPGGGARFTLSIPARPGTRPQATPSRPTRTLETPSGGPALILLAEDEDNIRRLVARSLRQQGYAVLTASDGAEALTLWDTHGESIDLLFLDVRMPEMDGPEMLRRARRTRPEIAAVFSSGYVPDEAESQEVFERVAYLPKPYRVPDLLATVRRALDLGDRASDRVDTLDEASYGAAGRTDHAIPAVDEALGNPGFDPTATIGSTGALRPISDDSG